MSISFILKFAQISPNDMYSSNMKRIIVPCRKNGRLLDDCHLPQEQLVHTESGTSSHCDAPPQRNPQPQGHPAHPSILLRTPAWSWTSPPSWCWVGTRSPDSWPWFPLLCHQWLHSGPLHSPDWDKVHKLGHPLNFIKYLNH